ncbi:50S ribosomal protein L4 [Patescibacteria group bacterium]|nr:50S ribosomal protein L4 [Patescibacteria group bacterium]MBU2220351.1 50S ribosomal protein L4 [Patescibacteria group bacterium]
MATPAKKTVAKKAPAKKTAAAVSMEATIWNAKGTKAGTVQLPEELFGLSWNSDLVHQVVVGMQANARATTAHTKFRGEVSGGGKKPWKQKGTGRARHGSNRSPIWKGGGVTHGPRAEKDYSVKINRKMRVAALATVLSRKHRDGQVIFVDSFGITTPSTKEAKAMLVAIANGAGVAELATKRKNAAVVAFAKKDTTSEKSFRNIGSLTLEEVRNLNPVDLVNKKYLVIENPTDALPVLSARLAKKG